MSEPAPTDAMQAQLAAEPFRAFTGKAYFDHITVPESNRRARAWFQDLALQLAPPGGVLFDFGAGPGIDSRYFAELGFTVGAYDVDPQMRDFFQDYCRQCIAAGSVRLEDGDYGQFLDRPAPARQRVDLIVSNFAPLNQIDDLSPLFRKFHALTGPGGRVLASVLNPCFGRDLRCPYWWQTAPRLWLRGSVSFPGGLAPPHNRRRLASFARHCRPYFRLARVLPGQRPARARSRNGFDVRRGPGLAWLRLLQSQFMFLLFERCDQADSGTRHPAPGRRAQAGVGAGADDAALLQFIDPVAGLNGAGAMRNEHHGTAAAQGA